jgi:hypothetical protein
MKMLLVMRASQNSASGSIGFMAVLSKENTVSGIPVLTDARAFPTIKRIRKLSAPNNVFNCASRRSTNRPRE